MNNLRSSRPTAELSPGRGGGLSTVVSGPMTAGQKIHFNASTAGSKRGAKRSAKTLSSSAVNIKRREDYQNMDPASKDKERTRVKRCRAIRMAKDLLAATAWQALDRKAQWELQMLVERELKTQ